jgi:2-polyprenyl-6-methoxyphenol hydroxylase-like FAD-dependent oxidoreductase
MTSLVLAKAGLEVVVIDKDSKTTSRSYACALHPRTLRLLQRFDLAAPLIELGQKVQTVAFYDQATRQTEVSLAKIDPEFPFLLILPQNVLEDLLEQRLRQAGGSVYWSHRFDAVEDENEFLGVTVEELEGTSTGYIVPHWETVVKRRSTVQTQFLVGADGNRSLVRQRAGLDFQRVSPAQFFAAYEFTPNTPVENEVRVVLNPNDTNVLWPLAGNRCRWTFQLTKTPGLTEFPQKDRRSVRITNPAIDEQLRAYVQKVADQRAPWFKAGVQDVTWCTEVFFEQRITNAFGRNRIWLAGDAAHQTGPVGIQSMNLAFCEAVTLAEELKKIIQDGASLDSLAAYDRQYRAEWASLLGLNGGLKPRSAASPWTREHTARLLPCLPSTHADLVKLAGQLQLDFTP